MSRGMGIALAVAGALLVLSTPASAASKNVKLLDNLQEAEVRHGDQLPAVPAQERRDARRRAASA